MQGTLGSDLDQAGSSDTDKIKDPQLENPQSAVGKMDRLESKLPSAKAGDPN